VAILPAHEVGGRAVLAKHLQYLAITLLFSLMVPADDEAIAWSCPQG
jgi:hypothetical protein